MMDRYRMRLKRPTVITRRGWRWSRIETHTIVAVSESDAIQQLTERWRRFGAPLPIIVGDVEVQCRAMVPLGSNWVMRALAGEAPHQCGNYTTSVDCLCRVHQRVSPERLTVKGDRRV